MMGFFCFYENIFDKYLFFYYICVNTIYTYMEDLIIESLDTTNNFLAKNDVTIKNHSEITNHYSELLYNKLFSNGDEREERILFYSSYLHDIGKLTSSFQKFLNGIVKKPNNKYSHNEIGWAFLTTYLSDDFKDKEIINNIVYWHHGITNEQSSDNSVSILNSVDQESINNMITYLISVVGEENVSQYSDNYPIPTPMYYPNDVNIGRSLPILSTLRSILVTADRLGSEYTSIDIVDDTIIDSYFNMDREINVTKTKYDNTGERFERQKSIVSNIGQTTVVKSPAGSGKTLIGVLWSLKHREKVIWVVPRNTIAYSLYDSISKELSNVNVDTSVQLVLSGEIKKTNSDDEIYGSNIIITNIDNFLSPTYKNNLMHISTLVVGCTVIFDEFHELISNDPYFALFINIMRVRHRFTESKTLLLSATPLPVYNLWETFSKKCVVLPNKEEHYPAIHTKRYDIKISQTKPIINSNCNTLVIKNTISNSQIEMNDGEYSDLLHSKFLDDVKVSKLENLLSKYGKENDRDESMDNVVGTHMIQASVDVSFNHLVEDVLSPESTIQRIGRCDRFGDYENTPNITIYKPKEKIGSETYSNNKIIEQLYDKDLNNLWYEFIEDNLSDKQLTLDEIYVLYNKFSNDNANRIKRYVENIHTNSLTSLSNIYPIKFFNDTYDKSIKTAGSNKLRSSSNEIFFIVKRDDSEEWVGPFNEKLVRNIDQQFNEEGNILRRMKNTMKKIMKSNNSDFDYTEIINNKRITLDGVRRYGKKSNTPYIRYDLQYNEELGLININ